MIVLPESMNRIDVEDSERALSTIDNYIRYMCERIEFAMRNVTKNVSDAGVSSAEMYVLLASLQQKVANWEAQLSRAQGSINDLSTEIGNLKTSINTLSTKVGTIETNVSNLSTELSTANSNISALQTSINSLDERVKALESNTPMSQSDIDTATS